MTEPVPVRVTEAVRITRAAEVVETVRVTEYASPAPAERQGLALPCGEHPYSPECCSPMAASGMELDGWAETRRALPPGRSAPARPWWRWPR